MSIREEHLDIIKKYYNKGYITRKEKTEIVHQLANVNGIGLYSFATTFFDVDGREIYYRSQAGLNYIQVCLNVYSEHRLDFKVGYDSVTKNFIVVVTK